MGSESARGEHRMDFSEYSSYDGLGLAQLVRSGDVQVAELASLAADAVAKVNPDLNAVIEVYDDRLRAPNDALAVPGPFYGVPFLLKDLGATERGRKQECGSRLLEGNVADVDAFLTMRFRQSGVNIIGRTTSPEFGFTITTESVLRGSTRNPWDLSRSSGGSSGGSAAAVAAGVVPLAHATDGAGSIRIPASACGLVGLKPSRGRVSNGPLDSDISCWRAVEGFLTRTVRDTAAMLDAVQGPFPGEAFLIPAPQGSYLSNVGAPVERLRIGVALSPWGPAAPDPEVAETVALTAALCQEMGHDVVEVVPPVDVEAYFATFRDDYVARLPVALEASARMMHRPISSETVEPILLRVYGEARTRSAADYLRVLSNANLVTRQVGTFLESHDILLTPTLAVVPPPLGRYHSNRAGVSVDEFFEEFLTANPYAPLCNLAGLPAVSLPLGETANGLPIGVQFMSAFGREDLLIRLASFLEEASPWSHRTPSVHVSCVSTASAQ